MEKTFEMPVRRQPREKMSFVRTALLGTSALSGIMLGLAIPNLVSGDGLLVAIKSATLALGGLSVSYIVNRLAVDRGAHLVSIGYSAAGLVSVASILVVGGGLFSATYAGLTFNDVEQLSLEAHGAALSDFVSDKSAQAAQASRVAPAINALVADLRTKHDCEVAESCLSGNGAGGNGPVARALTEQLGTAEALAVQVDTGGAQRDAALANMNALYGQYQSAAGAADVAMKDKRAALMNIDLSIKQAASRLDEAMPVSLMLSYANGLGGGIMIADRPEASQKISEILEQHGQTLADQVRGATGESADAPAFPNATGVSDTFSYIGHFLPVAAIALVVELVFPISLWLYTVLALSWANYRVSPSSPRRPDPDELAFRQLLSGSSASDDKAEPYSPGLAPRVAGTRRPRVTNGRDDIASLNSHRVPKN